MTALARAGWRTLKLEEFARAASPYLFPVSRLSSDGKDFLLTFDDGYASLDEYAYPVLADLGFTATTFLVTDFIGLENTWDAAHPAAPGALDWPATERWRPGSILPFRTHRRPGSAGKRWPELAGSREALVRRLGGGGSRAGIPVRRPQRRMPNSRAEPATNWPSRGVGPWPTRCAARVPVYV
jgi:hypothetical protein